MVLRNESILSGGMTRHYAHTLHGRPPAEWQGLLDHLRGVAKRAEQYASAFGAGDWGKLAGLWHDLGKYSDGFQAYLAEATTAVCSTP
ncbi:MAG: CRISPR-associated endonuclease Cas3'' [Acidobacteriota bacterium]